jgi:c-di-GMP-binding flagellar brake protein YcgR
VAEQARAGVPTWLALEQDAMDRLARAAGNRTTCRSASAWTCRRRLPRNTWPAPLVVLAAAKLGNTRLIDNLEIAAAHTMRDPFDIGAALSTLAATRAAVTVYLPDEVFLLAQIDAVDPELRSFTLGLSGHAILPARRVTLVAALDDNARLQFDLVPTYPLEPGTARSLTLPFPDACLVLNRRAEARLDAPLGAGHAARFVLLGKVFELPLCDFSRGGVGMRATPAEALELYVGKRLAGVELELGPALVIRADLEVRLLRPFRTFLLGPQVQVGCRIVGISMQMREHLEGVVAEAGPRR